MYVLIFSVIIFIVAGGGTEQRKCRFTFTKLNHLTVENIDVAEDTQSESIVQGTNETCTKTNNYCYALWKEDSFNGTKENITILYQGCWESSGSYDCEMSHCIARSKTSRVLKDTYFCCCNENFCNEQVSHRYEDDTRPEFTPTQAAKYVEESYLLIVITVLILGLIVITALFMRKDFKKKTEQNVKGNQNSFDMMENGDTYGSNFTVENLRLETLIGQGRYGAVWRGYVNEQEVAVKIFPSHQKNYFYNELDIYCLPFMNHPSLLSYFGYDERTGIDGTSEHFLFLSLAPNGCVQDYLRANVLDWEIFCKMSLSVAKGVAYLHTDIQKGDKSKPCVTHRDLNTRNILVKEDLSCVICDLGFATKISGSKYYYNGEERHAETKSINDVGTLRYMSPEVLEGAVNLRDCETSLKQIDVYALGLVLWEISSRCSDFYPAGIECGAYKLPFEAEIGHPTFEQMQILVCRHKTRPLFPDLWLDSPAVRTVKETIEDCWDQDAEARLTALCVEERFHELSGINERRKSSIYPNGMNSYARPGVIQRESQNILLSDNKEGDSCLSESTVETLLAASPSNPQLHCKNSNQHQVVCPSLQPYQGRNLCLERNLMLPESFDSNSGELIHKSEKHIAKNTDLSAVVNDYMNLYVMNSTSNFTNGSCTSYSAHSEPITRAHLPIPFVQNVNAEYSYQSVKQSHLSKPINKKRVMWKNFIKVFDNRRRGNDISSQIDCNANSSLIVNGSDDILSTPTATLEVALSNGRLETKVARQDLEKRSNQGKCNAELFPTEENVTVGVQNIRRPTTLDLPVRFSNNDNQLCQKSLNNIEKSKRKRSPLRVQKRYSLNANDSNKKCERQVKTKSLSGVEELDKKALLGHETCGEETVGENYNEIEKKSLDTLFSMDDKCKLKDPNLRIKTPGDVPLAVRKLRSERNTGRFSLYDDRIMSGCYEDDTLYSYDSSHSKNEVHFLKSLNDVKF